MPQDPLPKLSPEQQDLWDEILRLQRALEELSKQEPQIFRIELEVVHPVAFRLQRGAGRARVLLHQLGRALKKAGKDPVFAQYSFIQRMQSQVEDLIHC